MATITNPKIVIKHDHEKKTADVEVSCDVNFTVLELCQMKTCKGRWFKLKGEIWGEDLAPINPDDKLYTFQNVFYFPDATPTATENKTFRVTVGEGLLNEDSIGSDEIYGKLVLENLNTFIKTTKKTNVVNHSF